MYCVKINSNLFLLTGSLLLTLLMGQCKSNDMEAVPPADLRIEQSYLQLVGQPSTVVDHLLDSVLRIDSSFTHLVSEHILPASDSLSWRLRFQNYFADSSRSRLGDSCEQIFASFDWKHAVGLPLALYHRAFVDRNIPDIYLLITDFNYGIFVFEDDKGEDALGVGAEMFLGNSRLYDQLALNNPNFSSYLNRTFNIAHLPAKVIMALLSDLLPPVASNRLLDHLINEGKKLYFTKQLIPGIPDTILHEYTEAQWEWVKENEWDIWRFLLADKKLYQSKGKDVVNLVQPAPHSQGMPPEAPGRAVNYIGLRIIESLAEHEKLSLKEIADLQNAEDILRRSRYKPR